MLHAITNRLRSSDERGAQATEYAMLIGFLVMLTITGIAMYGAALRNVVVGLVQAVLGWSSGS